jgi:glycosyltransferase involved in cell wall biosynthesis
VATASCGVEEIIKDGVTGRVVPLEDDAALAAAISETLSNPEQARIMADKLYELVRERFTWRRAAEQYAALMDPSTESRSH